MYDDDDDNKGLIMESPGSLISFVCVEFSLWRAEMIPIVAISW